MIEEPVFEQPRALTSRSSLTPSPSPPPAPLTIEDIRIAATPVKVEVPAAKVDVPVKVEDVDLGFTPRKPKDYFLKFWREPTKIFDKQGRPRWEFKCKFCPAIRTTTRNPESELYTDEKPRPSAATLYQHQTYDHPDAESLVNAVVPEAGAVVEVEVEAEAEAPEAGPAFTNGAVEQKMDVDVDVAPETPISEPMSAVDAASSTGLSRDEGDAMDVDPGPSTAESSSASAVLKRTIPSRSAAWKEKEKATDHVYKFWSEPRKIDGPRWEVTCRFCPEVHTLARDEACDDYYDEQPRPSTKLLRQHMKDKHPDAEQLLASQASSDADTVQPQPAVSRPETPVANNNNDSVRGSVPKPKGQVLKFFTEPRATTDAHGVPRWQFNCKFCPAIRTVIRNPLFVAFEDERPRPDTSALNHHLRDKHADAGALMQAHEAEAVRLGLEPPTPVWRAHLYSEHLSADWGYSLA
ncbi:hypothetical protein EXIGLDRAFT_343391 [Exidia glandulosa HHB12029]|uniref:Uncharacterized protein n=1 Tax=Exidia glandulosa HHB12029 TaxID=1314781 RepID=A0A165LI33_EXIGL|nr:hypothetical protein EXIGLDRAFT_343391 [Exidia glandulosa HHB12029]